VILVKGPASSRAREEDTIMGGRIRLIGALALVLGLSLVAGPATAQGDSSVDRARQWLDQQRKPDGSFDDGVFNPVDLTSNAVMGEVAAGSTPAPATMTWLRDSSAAAAYARKGPGAAAKLALAMESAGGDAGGLLTTIERTASGGTFKGVAGDYDLALAVLALRGGGRDVPAPVLDGLVAGQQPDGGWAFAKGQPSDTNTTAVALMAMARSGRGDSPAARRGVSFLDGQQFDSAGWGYDKRSKDIKSMDANSTGLVLSALSALGIDQQGKAKSGVSPRDALLRLQAPSGGFAFDPGKLKAGTADQLATAQALVGVAGRSLPVERPAAPKLPGESNHTFQIVLAAVVAVAVVGAGLGLLVTRRRS
jgi:hypothetical protein